MKSGKLRLFLSYALFMAGLAGCSPMRAQEYVEICKCERGMKGVCKEFLDSNWQITDEQHAVWYYYNYSFGKHRFFDWSWQKSFIRRHELIDVDSIALIQGVPQPLTGYFRWKRNGSHEIAVEQEFENGWPIGQTKAFSRKGYLLESLDFNSPYNNGKFSMMCHWYHRGKLEVQCVFAIDMNENKEYVMEIPSHSPEPPTTLGFVPKYRRSLVLDIQGLKTEFISEVHTPVLFHLISESSFAPEAEPLSIMRLNSVDSLSESFVSIYSNDNLRHRQLAIVPPNFKSLLSETPNFDVRTESSEFMMLKTVKSELRQRSLRHVLLSMDTLNNVLNKYGKGSSEFYATLEYVDRCVSELMLLMRLNSRELDWNCVLITSSNSGGDEVPWLLWGEGVRPNFKILKTVSSCESRATFAQFAHLRSCNASCMMKSCFYSTYKRGNE